MKVHLIAHTVVTGWGHMRDAGWVDYVGGEPTWGEFDVDADYLAEFAGRLCYQSWDRPNPATATNEGYLANIQDHQHFSVLEHSSATFYVAGVSRSLSHELVRHRHLSFSQVSQRYVDESKPTMVTPPAILTAVGDARDEHFVPDELPSSAHSKMAHALQEVSDAATYAYEHIVKVLAEKGLTRKEARQAARAVLPNATETKFVVTGNLRAWRDVIAKRNSPHADAEIQQLAAEILRQLKEIAPNTFQDIM